MESTESSDQRVESLASTEPSTEHQDASSSIGLDFSGSEPTSSSIGLDFSGSEPTLPSKVPTIITSDSSLGATHTSDPGSRIGDPNITPVEWEPQVVKGSLEPTHPSPGESFLTAEDNSTLDLSPGVLKDKVNATFQSDLSGNISAAATYGDASVGARTDVDQTSFSSPPSSQTSSSVLTPSEDTPSVLTSLDTSSVPSSEDTPSVLTSEDSPSVLLTTADSPSVLHSTPGAPSVSSSEVPSLFLTSTDSPSSFLNPSMNSLQRDSSEPVGDSDEEYFEEFHLPNTHENAFVRHLSFRRKVQTTPIHAPDAERIEGLVRTGEFVRHGSIRKKIVPEEKLPHHEEEEDVEEEGINEEEEEEENKSSSFSQRMERDIREIERYLSEDNGDVSFNGSDSHSDQLPNKTPSKVEKIKRTTSTPKTPSEAEPLSEGGSSPRNLGQESIESRFEDSQPFEESRIEDSTLRKIQDCLDFSSYKDLLNLSGRLSDLLSPKEVEEVLHNSERYRQYLDSEVFEALSLSFQGQTQSLPCNINVELSPNAHNKALPEANSNSNSTKSIPNTDSGFSSPKSPKEEKQDGEADLQVVRRNSVPIDGIAAEGIFLETPSKGDLKRIPAPEINLESSSETKHDGSDEEHVDVSDDEGGFEVVEREEEEGIMEIEEEEEEEETTPRKKITVSGEILDTTEDSDMTFGGSGTVDVPTKEDHLEEEDIGVTTPGEIPEGTNTPPPEQFPAPPPPDLIPELTSAEELSEVRHWRNVVIGGAWRRIDMKVIAQYRKCISHGGYMEESQSPIVVLSAALLPERSRKDYHYVMDNLFMYVLSFLEQLVADDYVLVYFSGGAQNGSGGPGFHWMRRAYEMIDRRLRKNLKSLLVVHPSMWARTIVTLSRPFISAKFYRKLSFVQHLTDLASLVPLEQLEIPDAVKQADFQIMIKEKKKMNGRRNR